MTATTVPDRSVEAFRVALNNVDVIRDGWLTSDEIRTGLVAALGPALRALRLIGDDCEKFTSGLCLDEPNLSPYATYTAGRWCDPCIARAGLAGTLPEEIR